MCALRPGDPSAPRWLTFDGTLTGFLTHRRSGTCRTTELRVPGGCGPAASGTEGQVSGVRPAADPAHLARTDQTALWRRLLPMAAMTLLCRRRGCRDAASLRCLACNPGLVQCKDFVEVVGDHDLRESDAVFTGRPLASFELDRARDQSSSMYSGAGDHGSGSSSPGSPVTTRGQRSCHHLPRR